MPWTIWKRTMSCCFFFCNGQVFDAGGNRPRGWGMGGSRPRTSWKPSIGSARSNWSYFLPFLEKFDFLRCTRASWERPCCRLKKNNRIIDPSHSKQYTLKRRRRKLETSYFLGKTRKKKQQQQIGKPRRPNDGSLLVDSRFIISWFLSERPVITR